MDISGSVKSRLLEFIAHCELSVRAFESRCNLSNGFVKNISKGIGADKLRSILQQFPQLNSEWLLTGKGAMLNTVESNAKEFGGVYSVTSQADEVTMVNYVSVHATASFLECLSDNCVWEEKYPLIATAAELKELDKLKIFEVDGESMLPTISPGALILTKEIPEKSWHYAEGVVVAVYDEYVVVKRITANKLLTDNLLVLSSDNEKYGSMTVQLADIRALFKAKRIISSPIL